MASSNYNVNLKFTADTNDAKRQIQSLQQALQAVAKMPGGADELFDDEQLNRASQAALELQQHLSKAVNVNTGKLDLSRFSTSLKASNKDLTTYCNTLLATGEKGQEAFLQLATAISTADAPVTRVNAKLQQMGVTIKNAAKWQISSSVIHGFMGAVQSAYGYAEDLNKSLNDIRIVTGQNIEQMDKFAEKANKAAKSLSATTLDYTNASLIYYQQGLTDQEVEERTNVTIKMANAAGVSASTVSDQLTAVWNNFYDGSKSLEYYADVMTALGAATASSTDEISEGLEKFASVAETVGLSYEYATAALATVTATTRQSADVVGTAFKTLFARLQDLELGETLDDGTTLGQYSEALYKVGINIKDTNGEMKDMDDILDELGSKWDTLSKSTQVALAQTVAGTRQYTQLVSLMDNWDYFQENLGVANSSSGALQEQADIYAESWEAARDRVTAAAEAIYADLVNDDFFIDLLNGVEKALEGVKGLVEGLGGMKGILITVSGIFMTMFANKVPDALNNLKQNIMVLSGQAEKVTQQTQAQMSALLSEAAVDNKSNTVLVAQFTNLSRINEMKQRLVNSSRQMTQQEKLEYQMRIDTVAAMGEQIIKQAELVETSQRGLKSSSSQGSGMVSGIQGQIAKIQELKTNVDELKSQTDAMTSSKVSWDMFTQWSTDLDKTQAQLASTNAKAQSLVDIMNQNLLKGMKSFSLDDFGPEMDSSRQKEVLLVINEMIAEYTDLTSRVSQTNGVMNAMNSQMAHYKTRAEDVKNSTEGSSDSLEALKNDMVETINEFINFDKVHDLKLIDDETLNKLNEFKAKIAQATKPEQLEKFAAQWESLQVKLNKPVMDNTLESQLKSLGFNLTDIQREADNLQMSWQDYAASVLNASGASKQFQQASQALSQTFTSLAGSIMQSWNLINGLVNAIKTITSPDSSGWEKFGAAMSVVSSAIMTTVSNIKTFSDHKVKDSIINWANAKSEEKLAKAKLETAKASKKAGDAQSEETGKQVVDTVVNNSQGTGSGVGKVAGTGGSATLTSGGAATLGSAALAVAAVVAAIAVVVGIVAIAINQAQQAEKELERARESASQLKQNYEDISSAHDNLLSNISSYEEATNNLEELTKGTEEYATALKEANDAALALLQSNSNLTYSVQDGQIVIDQDSLEEQQTLSSQKVAQAQAASLAGQQAQREAAINLEKYNIARDMSTNGDAGAAWGNVGVTTAGGAAAGALIGSVIPVVGTAIGAAIGAGVGLISGAIANSATGIASSSEMDAIEKLAEAYNEDNSIMAQVEDGTFDWGSIGIEDESLISALKENADQVVVLAEEMAANTAALNAENDVIAAGVLANNTEVSNSDYQDNVIDVAGDAYGVLKDQILETADWMDTWGKDGISKATKVNDEAKKVFSEYLTYAGLDDQNYTLVDTQGTDKNRSFIYEDESGQEHTVYLETMQMARAAYEATGQLTDVASTLVTTFNELAGSVDLADQALLSFLSQKNFEGATKEEFGAFLGEVQNENGDIDESKVTDYLAKGGIVDDTTAVSFGYASLQDAIDKTISSGERMVIAWDHVLDNYVQTVQDKMGELDTSNLSYDEIQNLADSMTQAFANSGTKGIEALSSLYTQAMEDGFGEEFVGALEDIDWDDITPSELADALEDAGVETDYTESELRKLIDAMADANIGLDAAATKFKALHDIIDGLEFGDTLTEEKFQELAEKSGLDHMEDYFLQMADGTYKLIADADEFYNLVNEKSVESVRRSIEASEEKSQKVSALLSTDVNSLQYMSVGYSYKDGEYGFHGTASDKSFANKQIDFLELTGGADAAQIEEWREEVENGTLSAYELSKAVETQMSALGGATAATDKLKEAQQEADEELANGKERLASTATSVDELNDMLTRGEISNEAYNKALEAIFQTEAENEGFDFEEVSDYAYALMASADAMVETREEAARLAIAQKKMDRGMATLVETYEDWNEALESEDLVAKSKALAKLRDGMSDLTDVDMSKLPASFFETETNAKLLEQAINGDTEALRLLMGEAVKENALQMGLSPDAYSTLQTAIDDTINAINVQDLEVGATLNDAGMYEAFQQLLDSGAVTVEQMNDILSGIGFSPVIEYKKMSLGEAKRLNQKSYIKTADGQYSEVTSEMNLQDNAEVWVPVINADETSVKAPPSPSVTSNNSGGGGGSNKKIDITKKSDVVDRYKEINDSLDDNSQAMDKASKAADRLYGASRLKQMKKVNDLIQDEIKLNKTKREEALAYLATDKADLLDAASKAGLSFTFDEDGDISNYTEQMTKLYDQLHAAETSAMADNNVTDSEQEKIDAIQEKIDAVTDAISQYEETKGVVEELDDEIQEAIYEWQDNNLEMLQYELELKITVNDEELELIEYYLNKVEGDVYKIAEAWDLIGSKVSIAEDNLVNYEKTANEVYSGYFSDGDYSEYSQQGALDELSELRSNILNELTTLQELDAEKLAYYGNVLGLVSEELNEQTSKFDDLNTTLDHYKTLMDLTGNSKNYTDMKKILSTQADVQKNQADIAKREYEMYAAEVEDYKAKMEAAQAAGDTAAYELYKENYEAAYGYMVEAQDNMYSTTEAWLETMKELYQTQLEEIGKTLEESLTGGTSFDELTTAMERSASLQEEYLTTTNQIYETNKLMRQAQQEIDKTTNSVAKKKLAAYIQETEQLQNQGKLSNYELEIQQAKYDLLLAEIALEEAQSAKSTVRLQRDSEGNLGYVYTADSDKIADAEQELADKQNALYNIGLEGANEYSEKYAQTMQDMYETLSDLHTKYLEGEFASEEEYNNAVAAAKEYYYQKLEDYSSLYSVALTTDSRVVKDAWSSDYNDMMYKVEELKDSVENYLTESKGVIEQWAADCKTALEEAGLTDTAAAVENINTASQELRDTLMDEDGLLDQMEKQVTYANNVTTAYGLQRQGILELIDTYDDLIEKINGYQDAIRNANDDADDEPDTDLNPTTSNDNGSGTTSTTKALATGDAVTVKSTASKFATGQTMASFVRGGSYTVMGVNGNKILIGRNGVATGWVYQSDLEGFDTGGYTGSWGSYGKLAMLHEKELVLNAQDTENFLASMEVLDHILEVIDLQSASARIGGMLTSPTVGNSESVVEQHVEITANFPNATDHSEIEEAFNNLINQASQFANRK